MFTAAYNITYNISIMWVLILLQGMMNVDDLGCRLMVVVLLGSGERWREHFHIQKTDLSLIISLVDCSKLLSLIKTQMPKRILIAVNVFYFSEKSLWWNLDCIYMPQALDQIENPKVNCAFLGSSKQRKECNL